MKNKKKKLLNKKCFSLFIKIIFIIYLLIIFNNLLIQLNKSQIYLKEYQASVFPEIESFEKNINLSLKVFNGFRQINSENKLIEENTKFEISKNPDISIIMTIHNEDHILHKGIRSIQNQSLKNIEIIIIDDFSEDNSSEIIKEYQKEDPRILLISHNTNEGKIKSRSDGIKIAKGKYITLIDGDDAFAHKDILKNSLFIAKKADLDAVEFPGAIFYGGRIGKIIYNYGALNISQIIYQPELRTIFIVERNKNIFVLKNRVIWGKLIRNELFQKILKYIGPKYTEDYINDAEDVIMSLSLYHLAKSYYVMKEIGYYYTFLQGRRKSSIKKIRKNNSKIKEEYGRFKLIKFLMEKSNGDEKEKSAVFYEIAVISHHYYFTDKSIYLTIIHIYDKILEWGNLNIEQKKYIISLKNKALQKMNK